MDKRSESIAAGLHQNYWKRLVLFASRRVRDLAAAEDVAQETLRRVVVALDERRIENLDALPGFVFQTARNICMHHARSARREKGALLRFSREPRSGGNDPLHQIESAQRVEALRRAIELLDPDEQELLRILYVEGLSNQDAAKRLSLDPGTLRVRKHRLLKRLNEQVRTVTNPPERVLKDSRQGGEDVTPT